MTRIEARPGEQAAVAPAVAPAAAPKQKKGRQALPKHPACEGDAKLEAVPEDYDSSKHAALKEDDFADGKKDVFYDLQAAKYQGKADEWRQKAESFRALGGVADRKSAEKLLKNFAEMQALYAKLGAQGNDLSGLPNAEALAAMFGGGATEDQPTEG